MQVTKHDEDLGHKKETNVQQKMAGEQYYYQFMNLKKVHPYSLVKFLLQTSLLFELSLYFPF